MSIRSIALTLFAFCTITSAHATPYWIAWEGDDWPENQGWTHFAFNYFGEPLAIRTLSDGQMEIDGMASIGIADIVMMDRPGDIDPDLGEVFVTQWRLSVGNIMGVGGRDPGVAIFSDDGHGVSFSYGLDRIVCGFEGNASYPLVPLIYHTYELRSPDMRAYELFIDGIHVRDGTFAAVVTQSHVAWGDGVVGSASRSTWDYFRFGVIPEPASNHIALCLVAWCGAARSRHG